MEIDYNPGINARAIPLVTYQNKKFVVDQEAKEMFQNINYKNIGIISLVGKYRTGKSFLLNRVLLNHRSEKGFNVGPTIRPCTKGIWIWSEPILVKNENSNNKFPVFLIDTEGLGAYDEEINHDTKIFLIAILISSLFVLNSFGTIDENAINSLSFILNLSKTIKISQDSNSGDPKEFSKHFPSLFWLLRDFTLKLEDNEGKPITSKQYLEKALKLVKGGPDAEEKNKIRKMIHNFFPERDCFTLVRPLENEQLLQQLVNLDEKEFRKEFIEQAENFRNKVFSIVRPKTFFDRELSGDMLLNLLKSILDSINSGSIPIIENSWKYVCENEHLKNYDKILDDFKMHLRQFKDKNKSNKQFFSEYEVFQKSLLRDCLEKFKEQSLGSENFEYYEKLKHQLTIELKKFADENCQFYEGMLIKALEENSFEFEKKIENQLIKNHYEFLQEIDNFREITESIVPDFPSKKDLIHSKVILLIKKFMECFYVKQLTNIERDNINLKNDITNTANKNKIIVEEFESSKLEWKEQNEKFNNIIMNLKLEVNQLSEKLRLLELDKKNIILKNEKEIENLRKEYELKIEKEKSNNNKLDIEIKCKEDEILNIKYSNEKNILLINQKIEFLNEEISSYKSRFDIMKSENMNLVVENEQLQGKVDDLKSEINKKKLLEFEMDKLKSKEKKFNESSAGFYNPNSEINMFQASMDKENLSNLIIKTNLENTKQQLEDTRKIYEEVINTLKANFSEIPQNLVKVLETRGRVKLKVDDFSATMKRNYSINDNPNTEFKEIKKRHSSKISKQNESFHENNVSDPNNFETFNLQEDLNLKNIKNENEKCLIKECKMDNSYDFLIETNKNLSATLIFQEEKLNKLEEEIFKIKEQNDLLSYLSSIQCKKHYKNCESDLNSNKIEYKENQTEFKIKIEKVVKREEGKSYDFILLISFNENNWVINRKLSQFSQLAKLIKSSFSSVNFPDNTKLFSNSSNENKGVLLNKFIKDILDNNEIKKSNLLKSFLSEDFNESDFEKEFSSINYQSNQPKSHKPPISNPNPKNKEPIILGENRLNKEVDNEEKKNAIDEKNNLKDNSSRTKTRFQGVTKSTQIVMNNLVNKQKNTSPIQKSLKEGINNQPNHNRFKSSTSNMRNEADEN